MSTGQLQSESLGVVETDVFAPIRPDFADFDTPVRDSFRWNNILDTLQIPLGQEVALYAFRSEERADVDHHILAALDEKALLAAEESEGFIYYRPNKGLSYCLWESTVTAEAATSLPAHREAAQYAVQAYEKWSLNCWMIGRSGTSSEVSFAQLR